MRTVTLWEAGQLVGFKVPDLRKRADCPFQKHKRSKTFVVYPARSSGDVLWKCHSCDEPNSGDAVAFYAKHRSIDRVTALEELRERGYDSRRQQFPGPSVDRVRDRRVIPIVGRPPIDVTKLDLADWRRWKGGGRHAINRFCAQRMLEPELAVSCDMLEIDDRHIGFGYRDPASFVPCRVKIREVEKKVFWVVPKGEGNSSPYSPLYLAHALRRAKAVVITEGEVDALTLKSAGIANVVSLPDGSSSAATVDLEPIAGYGVWFLSIDDDQAGHEASCILRKRAWQLGAQAVPLYWRLPGAGRWKDVNEARCAGISDQGIRACIDRAAEAAIGYVLELVS